MKIKRLCRGTLSVMLASFMLVSAVACRKKFPDAGEENAFYTYNEFTAVSPSNWNELTYRDNNDTQIMRHIGSSFFAYDFRFDEEGNVLPDEHIVKYDAATKLEDVSADYVGDKWGVPEGGRGYAYKITLREDLKWDDGTPIKAEDFVWSMKQQLDPLFRNYRADSFYTGALIIVNAEKYAKQGQGSANTSVPETKFEEVGIFVGDTAYEIILILAKPIELLKEDGSLSYKAAYNLASLPLVHKEKYEASKVAPSGGTELWTTTYNTDVASTASWGPYKLESFQAGKEYTLTRNENWYGYGLVENQGLYQTDRIVCTTIKEWNAAWLKFRAGEIDSISIDVTIADDYKNSSRALFTPDDFVGSLQLQSNTEQLKARESAGINKSILSYSAFRRALSLSIDRSDFAAKTTTSAKEGFGLFNSTHYYDVENNGAYRSTEAAQKVLCEIYAVDYTKYPSLEAAVETITGYNLEVARGLVTQAYNEALAAGDIKATDRVLLTFGAGAINETMQRRINYIANAWTELVKGTPLEGRLVVETKDFGDAWATDFRAGGYDVCIGGWTGAAWDPGYFLLAYLSPAYMYSAAWDTASAMMEFTMKGVGENGGDVTETMSLLEWYNCLNGVEGARYDWSESALDNDLRLQLIAALEQEVLQAYYTVPLYNNFSASLLSYKVDYITYEYNTFMGYGGLKYMKYRYDDKAWAAEVAKHNGELNYKN